MRLQEKAERLARDGLFLGGPARDFEAAGRLQLIALLRVGLHPDSKVVDIGCGCLRGGYWLIHFLDPGCYFGIEPATEMLEAGAKDLLEQDVREQKRPRLDTNADFDTSIFGVKFDFFLARSVWTHASKSQIRSMLDSFGRDAGPAGVFLTSYLPAGMAHPGVRAARRPIWRRLRRRLARLRRRKREAPHPRDYQGDGWSPELVHHSIDWVRRECHRRGLSVAELEEDRFNDQVWLLIKRSDLSPQGSSSQEPGP